MEDVEYTSTSVITPKSAFFWTTLYFVKIIVFLMKRFFLYIAPVSIFGVSIGTNSHIERWGSVD